MSDRFTEISTQGWLGRLGGSLVAALIGLILVPVSIGVLYWNEGRAVEAIRALSRGAAAVVEVSADTVDPQSNGRLVHLSGMLQPGQPARDPVFGVTGQDLVRLSRSVEMYQWQEHTSSRSHESVGGSKTTETTYSYDHVWSQRPIASSGFRYQNGHENPAMPVQSATFAADGVRLGAWPMDTALLDRLNAFTPLSATVAPPAGWQPNGDGFYRGADPAQPAVGDLRARFAGVPAQTVSIVAAASGGRLTPYRDRTGYTIALAQPGVAPAAALFHAQATSERQLTWILRGGGFLALLIGFICIARPLSMLFAILPPLEWLAEAGAFFAALALAVPIALVTIAVAWLAHRPVIGVGLLVAAFAAVVLLQRMHRARHPVAVR